MLLNRWKDHIGFSSSATDNTIKFSRRIEHAKHINMYNISRFSSNSEASASDSTGDEEMFSRY